MQAEQFSCLLVIEQRLKKSSGTRARRFVCVDHFYVSLQGQTPRHLELPRGSTPSCTGSGCLRPVRENQAEVFVGDVSERGVGPQGNVLEVLAGEFFAPI